MKRSEIQTRAPRVLKWRRWRVVTKFKLRALRKALDQEKRAHRRAKKLVRELSKAGHVA